MSIPTTCHKRDTLFHVLYGANLHYIGRMIEESALNIAREYPSSSNTTAQEEDGGVASALQLLRPQEGDSLHRLQIKFLILLNEDETMRRNIGNVSHSSLIGSLCPRKAERFYDALSDELIPLWIKDCGITHGDFLDKVRASYLNS
jgi:hypothetical protein